MLRIWGQNVGEVSTLAQPLAGDSGQTTQITIMLTPCQAVLHAFHHLHLTITQPHHYKNYPTLKI